MTKAASGDSKSTLYCSFCGKSQHEVRKLIAGPTVFICDECVELCMDIIREEHKIAFVKSLAIGESRSPIMTSRGERGIWQRRYWEHTIRDDRDYAAHMDYIHFNPVKHGLTRDPSDWPFSSFRQSVAAGLYPAGWLGGGAEPVETGERR